MGGKSSAESVVEQWPNLAFLGFGVWIAWISLCYYSPEVTAFAPDSESMFYTLVMYVVSTLAIALCMFVGAANWRVLTPLLDRRGVVLGLGALAALSTFMLEVAGFIDNVALFCIFSFLTGVGTSALCVKVGRIYGSVSLADSLVSASMSLLLAVLLYFVGVGVPEWLRMPYIALLPLAAACLLSMPIEEPFPAVVQGHSEGLPRNAAPRRLYRRLVAMLAWVAFTAGVGSGIGSVTQTAGDFAYDGSLATFATGLVALALVIVCCHRLTAQRAGLIYTLLMLLGVVIMLCTSLGVPLSYLVVGKDPLWLLFTCFIAYISFKFGLSSIRAFGIAQGIYFVGSTLGWLVGAGIAPFYGQVQVQTALAVAMAVVTVIMFFVVFTEADVRRLLEESADESPEHIPETVVVGAPPACKQAGVPPTQVGAPEAVIVDDLSRARDEHYGLSARELEVLELFAQGRSANWIADHLVISKNTVRTHLRNSYGKLDVHSRQELLDFLAGKEAPSS